MARSPLESVRPWIVERSWTTNWNQALVPEGMPAGQVVAPVKAPITKQGFLDSGAALRARESHGPSGRAPPYNTVLFTPFDNTSPCADAPSPTTICHQMLVPGGSPTGHVVWTQRWPPESVADSSCALTGCGGGSGTCGFEALGGAHPTQDPVTGTWRSRRSTR